MVSPEQGGQLESAVLEAWELFEEGGLSFFVYGAVPDDVITVVVLKGARAVYGSVEQTRGQRQTGRNDLPGRVREVAKWIRARSVRSYSHT